MFLSSYLTMDDDGLGVLLSDEGKRRLLSASGPGAGSWLTALPTRGDLRMSGADFAHAVRLRLGIVPACMEDLRDQSMVCECGQWHDPAHPAQMMCCPKAGGGCVWFRHNVVRDTVAEEAKAAGYSVLVEEVTVNGQSGQHLRTDVSILDYGRKKAQLDFAITDPTRRSVKRVVQGAAATETANRKIRESKEKFPDLDPYDDVFVPAIMETYGLMHTDLRKVLRTLAEKRLSKSGMDTSFSSEEQSILLGSVMNSLYQKVYDYDYSRWRPCGGSSSACGGRRTRSRPTTPGGLAGRWCPTRARRRWSGRRCGKRARGSRKRWGEQSANVNVVKNVF